MRRLRNVRWRRVLLIGGLSSVLGVLLLIGIGYAMTEVPKPSDTATAQATRILYADRSEMGRVGQQNRIPVELDQVPLHVQQAVLAAEDRGHYDNPGINPKGIGRALFANIRGGGVEQGGSSITQQYAKNAFLTSERTFSRKVKEVFIALKMSRTVDKDQILEDYLNTIYFGRQASGIEVASWTYFNRAAKDLSVAQGALLATLIKSPASLDPQNHPEAARQRWEYVLDGMVDQGWLSQADRAKQVFPPTLEIGQGNRQNDLSGPKGHVITAVIAELGKRGFREEQLAAGGLVVQTTIRKQAQEAAVAAVQEITGDKPGADDLQGALVSVRVESGEIYAYYGGATGTGFDFANQGLGRQPGSSFKPYVLAAALESGMSLRTRLDGNNKKEFPGVDKPVRNFGNESYGRVDLIEATQRSVNTAYFELGLEVGPKKVAELAHAAGIPESVKLSQPDGTVEGGIALGKYEVHVLDQAVGFATFARKGVPVEPFLVKKVQSNDGESLYDAKIVTRDRAFSEDTAADATFAMEAVVDRGTGRGARLEDGRDVAGKTGTSQDNKDAWFVGYTPQLSTAVWLGYAQPKTIEIDGIEATGGGFSSKIWRAYTQATIDAYPKDFPAEDFPPPVYAGTRGSVGSDADEDRDEPTRRPRRPRSPRPETTTAPEPETAEPAPEPEPEPTRTQAPPPPPPPQETEPPGETEEPEPPPVDPSPGG